MERHAPTVIDGINLQAYGIHPDDRSYDHLAEAAQGDGETFECLAALRHIDKAFDEGKFTLEEWSMHTIGLHGQIQQRRMDLSRNGEVPPEPVD